MIIRSWERKTKYDGWDKYEKLFEILHTNGIDLFCNFSRILNINRFHKEYSLVNKLKGFYIPGILAYNLKEKN